MVLRGERWVFGYAFHADACKEMKNQRLIEDAIAEVMQERVIVATCVVAQKEEDPLDALTAAFGGSVVN